MLLYDRITRELDELKAADRYRQLPPFSHRESKLIELHGQRLLNLSSNDYLGLADNQQHRAAFVHTLNEAEYPMSSSSSRLLTGNHPLYEQLEATLATLYNHEAALVFNSGYHANIGMLPALAGRHDLILSDKLNHASIIDGMKIADAPFQRFRHCDYDHLEELLAASVNHYEQLFIVTESVFSMDGDCADLARLVALKRKYNAVLIVDEAHGVGVFGERGLGLCEATGTIDDVDIIIGTFGKAFASVGAYAVMNGALRDYLINSMRSLIFTTALPPVVLAWSLRMLQAQQTMQHDRQHLLALAATLRHALSEQGCAVLGESHIVPIITGSNSSAVTLAATLRDAGLLCMPVRPPTVPEKSARLRLSLRSILSWDDVAPILSFVGGVA